MGTKPGKHARDEADGGDGEGSPLPKKSPKSKKSSRSAKSASVEGGSPSRDIGGAGDQPGQEPRRSSSEKENVSQLAEKGEKVSSPGKGKSKGAVVERMEQEVVSTQQSPPRPEQREMEPLTPLIINEHDHSVSQQEPQATSTPAIGANGVLHSPPLSPGSTTDQSDDEAFTSNEQQDSLDSRRSEPNFGRFYNSSYLTNEKAGYLQRSSLTTTNKEKPQKSPHFHRPPNFTYAKDPPTFLKKKGQGMAALGAVKRVVKVRRSSSPGELRNEEAIRMSMYPSAQPKMPNEPAKIERDDWPAPASPAAILPEILRQRRRSRGEKDDDEDEEEVREDPKIKRELEEISKIKDESGIGRVIYRELEGLKAKPAQPLDPWKASRAPSAKFEPRYRTRFQSPMFASPSRFLDRPRYAWDDSDIRAYRSSSALTNFPTPRPGYGPSYIAPRAATLPLAGAYGARDFRLLDFEDHDDRRRSTHTSSSTLTGESGSRRMDSSYTGYEGPSISLLKLQKSTWHTECEPPVYSYEQLKITQFDLPKDVDTNHLEIHLANDEFEGLFKMNREQFYRLAEWKRNDIKRKLDLY